MATSPVSNRQKRRWRVPAPTASWSAAARRDGRGFPGQLARYLAGGRQETAPPLAAQRDIIVSLYDEMLGHHGERIGLKHARKHIGWALDTAAGTAAAGEDARKEWRRHVLTAPDRRETERRLDEAFDALAWRAAA